MRTLLVIVLILNSAFCMSQRAEFFVESPTHKFPKTNEGVLLRHQFTVQNKGDSPLVISGFEVACSCTKVNLPGPIPPGGSAVVTVEFDTNGKYYQQDRIVLLKTNTRRGTEKLRFKVFVIPKDEQ